MKLFVAGLSYKTAPVELREKLAVHPSRLRCHGCRLKLGGGLDEVVLLSTCNRVEIYGVASHGNGNIHRLFQQLATGDADFAPHLYIKEGAEAARHLFSVASGLDSMVIGETEILGQLKRGFEVALEEQTTGPISNRLFGNALGAGKRVQTETWIGALKTSVSTTAVDLARETLGDLTHKQSLVIGAGGNGELTAKALSDAGVDTVFIANRHYDREIGVAESIGGRAVRFDKLPEELVDADIVVSSTGSPHTLIHADEMQQVMAVRGGRPLTIIDIAVPRDIDDAVGEIPGVTLFDMDDLQRSVDSNMQVRRSEAAKAESVVAQEVEKFERWMTTLDVIPTISELRRRGEAIAEQVVTENAGKFTDLTDEDRARLEAMATSIVSRMLHEPTLKLKKSAADDGSYLYIEALRELFGLDAGAAGNVAADDETGTVAQVHSLQEHADAVHKNGVQRGRAHRS